MKNNVVLIRKKKGEVVDIDKAISIQNNNHWHIQTIKIKYNNYEQSFIEIIIIHFAYQSTD